MEDTTICQIIIAAAAVRCNRDWRNLVQGPPSQLCIHVALLINRTVLLSLSGCWKANPVSAREYYEYLMERELYDDLD